MRNLVGFLWKHHFTLLFLFLELIAFLLLVQYNKFHRAEAFNTLLSLSGTVNTSVHNLTEYVELKAVNEELSAENADLRAAMPESFKPARAYYHTINDTLQFQQYTYIAARVVNSTVHKMNNQIIINAGTEQGVHENMGVICPSGVVGQVKHVSSNFAAVLPLIHKESRIGARFQKNSYFGLVRWQGLNPNVAALSDISSHVAIAEGDTVITRGSNTLFPAGIPIGTVSSFEAIPGEGEYEIDLNLTTDFSNLSHVYVVTNLLQQEQLDLEAKFNEEAEE